MANSWSFLNDELYGDEPVIETATSKDYNDFWENDAISMVGNPFPSAMGEDHISFDTGTLNLTVPVEKKKKYKYNEDNILEELKEYISGTYRQHYSAGDDKIQTLDLIEACGDGEAFCRSNILKYASRYDKKGTARRDIMKILHYAVLLMHFNDKNAQNETYPQ